ncbi:RICIN domain-containing protein [Streptomyces asoensis]|uniref:RICIN domain-containing protein n=1 Tax=Streptomyces asoensis TaxID=249586 RepID=UPI0034026872
MAGALLIAVPLLVMTIGDEKDDKKVGTRNVSDTIIDGGDSPAGAFIAESPSPANQREQKTPLDKPEENHESPKKSAATTPTPGPRTVVPKSGQGVVTKKPAKKSPSTLPTILTRVLIRNNLNGTCMDIPGSSSGSVDGPIIHSTCNGSSNDNQLWNLEKRSDGAGPGSAPLFQIRNVMDSMCLDLPGFGGANAATKITEAPCGDGAPGDNQLWWLDRKSDGKWWIRNAASNNMCLDSYEPNDPTRDLLIWPCAPEKRNNHEWAVTRP